MNKKIKIIDLLNKIANGEKKPEEIKYKDNIYTWLDYKYIDNQGYTFNIYSNRYDLDDEVEILEDNTEEIEELKRTENVYDMTLECYHDIEKKISNDELADKINEIIRYIKRKDKSND